MNKLENNMYEYITLGNVCEINKICVNLFLLNCLKVDENEKDAHE